ncbi:17-beta-hydroxysteroid dehydrogenase 13-like [Glandiceps talaboti]
MLALLFDIPLLFIRIGLAYLEALVRAIVPSRRKKIDGEVVLITGAGHGIGRCLALEFAKVGAKLVLWDINQKGNEATATEVTAVGARVNTYTVDLRKRDEIKSVAEQVKREVGHVDILVNNAGLLNGLELLRLSDDQIQRVMDVNIMAHFWTVRAFLPSMLDHNHGHIVTMASMAGKHGVAKLVDYTASKYAAVGFTEALTNEIKEQNKDGIKTTTVCPLFVDTGMTKYPRLRFPKLSPVMEPEYVAAEIIDGVLRNKEELLIPSSLRFTLSLKNPFIPRKVAHLFHDFFGAGIYAQDKGPDEDKDKDA